MREEDWTKMQGIANMWQVIETNFSYICVYAFPFSLVLVALIYLITQKNRRNHNYIYLALVLFLLWLCPFFAVSMMNFFWEGEAYYKALFLIPGVGVTAYALVCLYHRITGKKKWAFWIMVFLLTQLATGFTYTTKFWDLELTDGKVDAEVVEIADEIKQRQIDAYMLAPKEIGSRLREYDLSAKIYNEGSFGYDGDDMEKTIALAAKKECNLIVVRKKDADDECLAYLEKKDFRYMTETDHYLLYIYL